ncbi:MAG: tripartite tricarboxylate transporter permease, partial [Candidatus Micrarchaeota archaeon]
MSDALYLSAGFLLGFLGGLLPGLHSNTMISVLSSLGLDEHALAFMVMTLFPAHLVSSFIPSMFFGIPESGTVMAVLPGQRMVLSGRGLSALKTVLASCMLTALLSLALFPVSLDFFPVVYGVLRPHMGWVLLAVSVVLLVRGKRPFHGAVVFIAAGMLGKAAFGMEMADPFLPLFSGMFAMAAVMSYQQGNVPEQKDEPAEPGILRYVLVGTLCGMCALMIPGVGSPSQVAVFASIFMPFETMGYLALVSAISMSQGLLSFSTAASIGKSRVGATAWLSSLIDIESNLVLLAVMFLLSIALAALLAYAMRKAIGRIASLDFSAMNLILALYIVAVTL